VLFDFVDAGELKENADYKIRAMLRLYAENSQCRHIYFAGCHDVGYINELTPYASQRDRITLVRTSALHPEFSKLGLRIEEFPGVFRNSPLDGSMPVHKTPSKTALPPVSVQPMCPFFQKGKCGYGNACRNLHVKANGQPDGSNVEDVRAWRAQAANDGTKSPSKLSQIKNIGNHFANGNTAAEISYTQADSAAMLPDEIPQGKVPINHNGYRLDASIPEPPAEDKRLFNQRTATHKLCNIEDLTRDCSQEACQYDHSPITDGMRNALKRVVYGTPCPRRGSCRRAACIYGHVCQKLDCKFRGGKAFCKFPSYVHMEDMRVANFVDAELTKNAVSDGNSNSSIGASRVNSPPPVMEDGANGHHTEYEATNELPGGALLDLQDEGSSSVD